MSAFTENLLPGIHTPFGGNPGQSTPQRDWVNFGGTPCAIGGPPVFCASTTALAGKGTYVHYAAPQQVPGLAPVFPFGFAVTDNPATTGLYLAFGLNPHNIAALRFLCSKATDPSLTPETASVRGWLFGRCKTGKTDQIPTAEVYEPSGKYAFDLLLTAGALAVPSTSLVKDGSATRIVTNWVDTIAKTTDRTRTPGIQVTGSNGDGAIAEASFDTEGYHGLILHIQSTNANVGWLPQLRLI